MSINAKQSLNGRINVGSGNVVNMAPLIVSAISDTEVDIGVDEIRAAVESGRDVYFSPDSGALVALMTMTESTINDPNAAIFGLCTGETSVCWQIVGNSYASVTYNAARQKDIPTKVSQLENDEGYVTKSESETMVVMVDVAISETHTNYSSEEIHDAYRAGRTVLMNVNGMLGYLSQITPNGGPVQFTFNHENQKAVVTIVNNQVTNEEVFDTGLEPFVIKLDTDTSTTDKSAGEMHEAWVKGRQIFLNLDGSLLPLSAFENGRAFFSLCIEGAQILHIVDGNVVSQEVFEMALSSDIPTDDHINTLIDNKMSANQWILTDENTGKKYKLAVIDGSLTMTEVDNKLSANQWILTDEHTGKKYKLAVIDSDLTMTEVE